MTRSVESIHRLTECRANSRERGGAFTLVEILVVVAVIAILLGLLLPALSRGSAAARAVRCQTSLRSVAFDFTVFADPQLHPTRGEDETRTPGRFRLETFVDSQYGVDEFWQHGTGLTAARIASVGTDDPMRCAEITGELQMNRNRPCMNGALEPLQNISYGFNFRFQRTDPPGQPRSRSVLLDSGILQAGRAPLVWDVDAPLAVSQSPSNNPTFTAPPQGNSGLYASGRFWWPGLRHASAMNVAFVDGSVGTSKTPLLEEGWRWDHRPR
ncbi:MAG: prepilin-type N-terminal cleavage/methylation domain-containing protein [Phycisphaerales bacterium]